MKYHFYQKIDEVKLQQIWETDKLCQNILRIQKIYKQNRLSLIHPMDTYGVVGEDYGILYDKKEQGKFIELHHLNEEEIHKRSNHHQSNF